MPQVHRRSFLLGWNWKKYSTWLYFCPRCMLTRTVCRRRIRRQAKAILRGTTARQSSNLTEQRNILRTRLRGWEEILPIYVPGLLQHRASFESDTPGPSPQSADDADHPENATIWLPSKIPENFCAWVCCQGLAAIEEKIRTAHCYDNLDAIRNVLNVKSRLIRKKGFGPKAT
jgi:hypothetical protein